VVIFLAPDGFYPRHWAGAALFDDRARGWQDAAMVNVEPIKAYSDNYVWALWSPGSRPVTVVDPGEAAPVQEWLDAHDLELSAVLLTHHHGDHVGGVAELSAGTQVPVHGSARDRIRGVTEAVAEGDRIRLEGLELAVWEVPGHTRGHVAYVAPGMVFTGDTLFAGGCGRLFEGTAEQMHGSLQRLAGLPPGTAAYCGHEYTLANLSFALEVEPDNSELVQRVERVRDLHRRGLPTVPSTMGEELATNPFLRCDQPAVIAAAERFAGRSLKPGAEVLAAIRSWKDGWR
jgi:hydroxyacylglutathione hydrolase